MVEATITALAPWYGSKRRLAPLIVRELGPHSAYWEPFCGSMAVLLAKPRVSMETCNDLNGDLVNLARVIKHPVEGARFYRRARREVCSRVALDEAANVVRTYGRSPAPETPDGDRALAFFVSSWIARNGFAGTKSYNPGLGRRFTKGGGHPARRLESAVDSIPAFRRRLRDIMVLNEDGLELVERIEDKPGVVLYADPPYVDKGGDYVHDFDSEHHVQLVESLRRFKRTRVVVSYYDHETVRDLYDGWTFVDAPISKSIDNQAARDETVVSKAPELLIINGESLTDSSLFD